MDILFFLEQKKVYFRAKQGKWAAHVQKPRNPVDILSPVYYYYIIEIYFKMFYSNCYLIKKIH